MTEDNTASLEAQYAEAIRREREALHALQAQEPGTGASSHAWQAWSDAIARTNRAWRELSRHAVGRMPHGVPGVAQAAARGADAPPL